MTIQAPALLQMPPKMLPIITEFNDWRYFLAEGGRGGGKSQAVARLILFMGDQRCCRIVCGRETQNTIAESVHAILKDLIEFYNLPYQVLDKEIRHFTSGTVIKFKGFRDSGKINVRGLEGVDILWIDEAQAITKEVMQDLTPTIRKDAAKIFFTMNRFMVDDPVYDYCIGNSQCKHININYYDNPFATLALKNEAEECRNKDKRDYNHTWLGLPVTSAHDHLFNMDKLHNCYKTKAFGDLYVKQRVVSFDFAAGGGDMCVASILDRRSNQHWELSDQIGWSESDTTISTGKIVNILGDTKPDLSILDVGGMGYVVRDRLHELKVNIQSFDGASTWGVNLKTHKNVRAKGYYDLKEWTEQGFLIIPPSNREVVKQCERIKMKYYSSGQRGIMSKEEMRLAKNGGMSPDHADSLMMGVYACQNLLGNPSNNVYNSQGGVKRVNKSRR